MGSVTMYDIINRSPIHRVRHPFCDLLLTSVCKKQIHDTFTDCSKETCAILLCQNN